MSKPKRNISSDALLRRQQYLTNGVPESASEENPEVSKKPGETENLEVSPVESQKNLQQKTSPESTSQEVVLEENPEGEKTASQRPQAVDKTDLSSQESLQATPVAPETSTTQAQSVLSKKQLLQQYLTTKHGNIEADTIYFPDELYEALRSVWYNRKKQQRGFKKSYIVIEALLRHPEILEELQKQGRLKE